MADIIDTPLRLFAELTLAGELAGRYQLEFQRRVEVDGVEVVPVAIKVRDLTTEEGAAIINSDVATKTAELLTLNETVQGIRDAASTKEAELRSEIARLAGELGAAKSALTLVANADAAWDANVRNAVTAALQS